MHFRAFGCALIVTLSSNVFSQGTQGTREASALLPLKLAMEAEALAVENPQDKDFCIRLEEALNGLIDHASRDGMSALGNIELYARDAVARTSRAVQECRHTETAVIPVADAAEGAIRIATFEAFDGGQGAAAALN